MRKAIYPGSFDPFHNGHLNIVKRASKQVDELIIVIGVNYLKKGLIEFTKRKELIEKVIIAEELTNVTVILSDKLIIEVCQEYQVEQIIRSVRTVADFEYEKNIAAINRSLNNKIETIMYFANSEYDYISSSMIRELLFFNQNICKYVPKEIAVELEGENENL